MVTPDNSPTPLSEAVARLRYYYVPLPAPIDPPASMDPVYDDEDAEPSQHDRDVLLLLDAVAEGREDSKRLDRPGAGEASLTSLLDTKETT